MFTVCVDLVFRSKYVRFPIICSLQYTININTVEVDPHSDLLHNCIVKPKNKSTRDARVFYQLQKKTLIPTQIILFLEMIIVHIAKRKVRKYSKRVSGSFQDRAAFHHTCITRARASRIYSPSNWAGPTTLSASPTRANTVFTRDVRLRQSSKSLKRSEVRPHLVDNQSVISRGKSHSPTNSRPPNLVGCLQNRLGSLLGKIQTGGRWNVQEPKEHINVLELRTAFFALKSFMKDQNNKVICLKIDNSTAVAYLDNKGGTPSPQSLHLALEIYGNGARQSISIF